MNAKANWEIFIWPQSVAIMQVPCSERDNLWLSQKREAERERDGEIEKQRAEKQRSREAQKQRSREAEKQRSREAEKQSRAEI